jgi:ferrochelatase
MSRGEQKKIAVVLFNLGGPDGPESVRPFLENLFSDPAIVNAPAFIRRPLAAFIARARERSAIANYAVMGGASPLLSETQAQATALQIALAARLANAEIRVFLAMRYWGPSTAEAAAAVTAFAPDEVVLAPLYPQYSTTTTGSSMSAWHEAYEGKTHAICCWYDNEGLIEAHARRIQEVWDEAGRPRARLLFSAHGLPKNIVEQGDPYQWQIESTCAKVADRLGPGWDWTIGYQSRVGPLKWIGPSTPEAIKAAAADGVGLIVDPIAFVSEHIETLVELDRDYGELARALGVPCYLRVPACGVADPFIDGLANALERALGRDGVNPDGEPCAPMFGRCPFKDAARAV